MERFTAREIMGIVEKSTQDVLDECGPIWSPHFPKRMDEMTPTEHAIAEMVCKLTGTMTFLRRLVQEWKEQNPETSENILQEAEEIREREVVVKMTDHPGA